MKVELHFELETTGGTGEDEGDEPYEGAEGQGDEENGACHSTDNQDGPQENRLRWR